MLLLDTSILVDLLNGKQATLALLQTLPTQELVISVITLAELEQGFVQLTSRKNTHRQTVLHQLIQEQEINIIPVDIQVAYCYGQLQGECLKIGQPLGRFDALIAATALTYNFELVTRDEGFKRVPGLRLYSPS